METHKFRKFYEKPPILKINWVAARIGDCLILEEEDYYSDERNIDTLIENAKLFKVGLSVVYKHGKIMLFVDKTGTARRGVLTMDDVNVIKEYLRDGEYRSVTEMYDNIEMNGSRTRLANCLKDMHVEQMVEGKKYQNPKGGAPTTQYRLRPKQ